MTVRYGERGGTRERKPKSPRSAKEHLLLRHLTEQDPQVPLDALELVAHASHRDEEEKVAQERLGRNDLATLGWKVVSGKSADAQQSDSRVRLRLWLSTVASCWIKRAVVLIDGSSCGNGLLVAREEPTR